VEDTGTIVSALGDRINLEVDILAKHVEKLVKP
jgi:riboflavin synthase alpha subunit